MSAPVPPLAETVSVVGLPATTGLGDAVNELITGPPPEDGFTTNDKDLELDFDAESVTVTVTVYVLAEDGVQLKELEVLAGHPGGRPLYAYDREPVPPLALTEKVVAVPTVTGLGVAVKEEIVGGFPPLPEDGHPPVAPPTS